MAPLPTHGWVGKQTQEDYSPQVLKPAKWDARDQGGGVCGQARQIQPGCDLQPSSGRICCPVFAKLLNKILLPKQKEKHLLCSRAAVVSNKAAGPGPRPPPLLGGIVVTSNYFGEFHGVKDN